MDPFTGSGQLWAEALSMGQARLHPGQAKPITQHLHLLPNAIMFPPNSLGLTIAACVCVAAARQSLSNLHDDCEFTLDRSRYDLCPLFLDRGQDRVVKVYAEPIPNTQLFYEISFGGPLRTQSGMEAEPQVSTGEGTTALLLFKVG